MSYFDRLKAAALEGNERAYRALWTIAIATLSLRIAATLVAVNLACDLARTLWAR